MTIITARDFAAAYTNAAFHPDAPYDNAPFGTWLEDHFHEGNIDVPFGAEESEYDGTGIVSWFQAEDGFYGSQPAFDGYYFIPYADIPDMPDFPARVPSRYDDEDDGA